MEQVYKYFEKLDKILSFQKAVEESRLILGIPKSGFGPGLTYNQWRKKRSGLSERAYDKWSTLEMNEMRKIMHIADKLLGGAKKSGFKIFGRDSLSSLIYFKDYLYFGFDFLAYSGSSHLGLAWTEINNITIEKFKKFKNDYQNGIVIFMSPEASQTGLIALIEKDYRVMRKKMVSKSIRIRAENKDGWNELVKECLAKYGGYSLDQLRDIIKQQFPDDRGTYPYPSYALAKLTNQMYQETHGYLPGNEKKITNENFEMIERRLKKKGEIGTINRGK